MKTTIRIIAISTLLFFIACKKEQVTPQPTHEQINAQFDNHYSRVTFYNSSTEANMWVAFDVLNGKGNWTAQSTTQPNCGADGFVTLTLKVGTVCNYTATIWNDPINKIGVKQQWTGTATSPAEGQCSFISIK